MIVFTLAAAATAFQQSPCGLKGVPADFESKYGVQCGWVTVPRDGSSGKTIRLWAAKFSARSAARKKDPILYINGGPGIATVDSVLPAIPDSVNLKALGQDRDIIMFDQRGSGRSEESLCPGLAKTLNAIAASGLDPAEEEDRSRAAFVDCRSQLDKAGIGLGAYSTAATVADVETVRKAFGVEQWNLLAISYGTLVALHTMRMHPHTVRSAILNSPYPPNSGTWAEQASGAASAYQAIDRACAEQPACRTRFGNIATKLEATIARLEQDPIKDGDKKITGRLFASALWPLAVQSKTVRFVPLAIARAYSGDQPFIKKLVSVLASGDAFGDFAPAQGYAISCHESGRTREWYARAKALYPGLVSAAPPDSWDRMCASFRPDFADAGFFAPVASAIPTLIYAGTLDPSVPVVDAYQTMRFLSKATLIEVAGASHAPIGADDCTRGVAVAFLREPEAPADTSCMARRIAPQFALDGLDEFLNGDS